VIGWWIIRTVWTSPHSARRFFRARKRDRGYQALSTGLIAAGAGNAALAHKMSARARGLLRADQEPLILVLEAQAAAIEGKHEEARRLFQQMADDPETRELGLRGLYVEATRLGALEAARQYAENAAEQAPYLPWAAKATLEYRCQSRQWDDAIRLLDQQRVAHVLSRAEADRLKAVLLTARAEELLEGDPVAARDSAVHALKLAKDLVPAAVVAAKAYLREDNLRKASSILEQVWKLAPHPDIAHLYVRARGGDSAVDRLKRAERLEALKPNNVEGLLIVAEAALDSQDFAKARSKGRGRGADGFARACLPSSCRHRGGRDGRSGPHTLLDGPGPSRAARSGLDRRWPNVGQVAAIVAGNRSPRRVRMACSIRPIGRPGRGGIDLHCRSCTERAAAVGSPQHQCFRNSGGNA